MGDPLYVPRRSPKRSRADLALPLELDRYGTPVRRVVSTVTDAERRARREARAAQRGPTKRERLAASRAGAE